VHIDHGRRANDPRAQCATLARSYPQVADGHADEPDVRRLCEQFAAQCDHQEEQLKPFTAVSEYAEQTELQQKWLATRPKTAAPQPCW
jgi:hypothetical protein